MTTVSELDYQVSKDGIHEIWRREWENSAALRREFRGDMESFVAFKAAELQGRVRIVAPKAAVHG